MAGQWAKMDDGKFKRSGDADGQRQQSTTMAANEEKRSLWREVSCDFLKGLDVKTGSKSAESKPRMFRKHRRRKSFDFNIVLDPPSKLIGAFLQRQKASGSLALDMDLDMEELSSVPDPFHNTVKNLSSLLDDPEMNAVCTQQQEACSSHRSVSIPGEDLSGSSTPCELRAVSFDPAKLCQPLGDQKNAALLFEAPVHRPGINDSSRSTSNQDESSDSDPFEELRSPPISSLNRMQSRSRLADPPLPPPELRHDAAIDSKGSTRVNSTQLRSGLLAGKTGLLAKMDEEEDDPLKDGDIPQAFKENRWDAISFIEWIAFIVIMGWLICSLTIPGLKALKLWNMILWKWGLLVLLVFCGRLVSGWIMRIIVLCLEMSFLLRKRVLYFVYALRKGVQKCLWFTFVLFGWRFIFDPKVDSTATTHQKLILSYVTKVLYCFLIAAVIWLIKIFCLKVLASSFHVSTYFDRIQESLFSQYVLETLSGPPVMELENEEAKLMEKGKGLNRAGSRVANSQELLKRVELKGKTGVQSGRIARRSEVIGGGESGLLVGRSGMIGLSKSGMLKVRKMSGMLGTSQGGTDRQPVEDALTIDDLHRLNRRNISAWNMKRLINLVRYRGITTLAHAIDASAHGDKDVEIQSEWQARAAARKIFKNVAKPGASSIVQMDLMRFMPKEEVTRAMPLFEGAIEAGKISKNAVKNFSVRVFRERRALALTLNDTKTAVNKLHRIIDILVSIIIIIIWLLVLGITTRHLLLFLSSQLLLMVFIFGNTCKTVFEAIVFLFVMHPLDVGDRCMVDGNQMVVEEMNILSTSFVRYDGEKVWYPNSILCTKSIINYFRTPDTGDIFNFSVHMSTPVEKITALRERIGRYIEAKPSHWTPEYYILVQEIEDMNRMKMQLMVNHTINFHDVLERQIRRSHLIMEVKRSCEDLEMEYHMLPQEVTVRECT